MSKRLGRTGGLRVVSAAAILTCCLVSCKQDVPKDTAAFVNGRPIAFKDVDRAMAAQMPNAGENKDEQSRSVRLETLRSLIDGEIMLQGAEKAGLLATDADVDAKFSELKTPYTEEEFKKVLTQRKMDVSDLRAQLRRELSVQKLLNKEIGSHISISDAEVTAFYNANKATFNFPEDRVRLAQIMVTGVPDKQVHNLGSDKAQTEEQAKNKIQMIQMRLRQGEDFATLAQKYSEDPNSSPNGGDLGYMPQSALDKANPDLRRLILNTAAGQISPVIHTQEGYRVIKVMSKEPAGQRELSDPRVQESIRQELFNRKDQLLRAAFFEMARNESKVTNFFAQSILGSRDKR